LKGIYPKRLEEVEEEPLPLKKEALEMMRDYIRI